jgi:hypothetical protein
MKYTKAQIEKLAAAEDARVGLPIGTTAGIIGTETGWQDKFLTDKRVPHYTGAKPKSSASGLGGFLDGTARDPGYGVKPLGDDWSIGNQVRFIADYAQAQIKRTGGLEAGLAAYGEGPKYAQKVLKSVGWRPSWDGVEQAKATVPPAVGTQVPQPVASAPAQVGNAPPINLYSTQVNNRLAELNKLLGAVPQEVQQAVVAQQPQQETIAAPQQSNYMNMFGFNKAPTVAELSKYGLI